MSSSTHTILYKNSAVGLEGTLDGSGFEWPGNALTANTAKFHRDLLAEGAIAWAYWTLAWNPRVNDPVGFSPTAVRLVDFDDGPQNLFEIARITSPASQLSQTPRVDTVNIAVRLANLIAANARKDIGHQTYGNGANGCLIYGSWIEIVWN